MIKTIIMNAKAKAILAFITIFLLGMMAGYFLNNVFHKTASPIFSERGAERSHVESPGFRDRGQTRMQPDSDRRRQWIENHFTERLDLQENQKNSFFTRISEYNSGVREKISDFRNHERDMLREYYMEFRLDVSAYLTEEQLARLDEMVHPDSVHRMRMERLRSGRSR